MKKNYLLQLLIGIAVLLFQIAPEFSKTLYGQDVITEWDFNNITPGDISTATPTTGSGTMALIGGVITPSTGSSGVGSSDPTAGTNLALQTTTYPAQGTNSGTAGIQVQVSTLGLENIVLTFDMRLSNTACRWYQVFYTTNGNDYSSSLPAVRIGGMGDDSAGDTWHNGFTADFTGITSVNDNPNFGVRIVSVFSPIAFTLYNTNFYYDANTGYEPARNPSTGANSNYGTAGTWRFDMVSFSGDLITGGVPVKLSITSVNGGNSPIINLPFTLTVRALDADDLPANVTSNTEITLTKETGTGILSGTLIGTINAGSNIITFNDVIYNTAETGVSIKASATAGMSLTPAISEPFEVLGVATDLKFVNVPVGGNLGQPIAVFTVEARRPDNTVDETYTGLITITKFSGTGIMSGTTEVAAVQGVATFNTIQFDESGPYVLEATAVDLASDISSVIVIYGVPTAGAELLPLYISGSLPENNRVPFAFRASLSNLIPDATYKFINQAVISNDGPTINGAGNPIFVDENGVFTRTTTTGFATPGQYGEFTTDQNGSFTGWFVLEPTGNARFSPGNAIYMRIRINNGAGGNSVSNHLTISDSVKVIGFSTDPDPDYGTGFIAPGGFAPKNFAFLYDDISKSGRPLFGTTVESIGIDFSVITTYAQFYRDDVSGLDGVFGGILPNINPDGVRLIEERLLDDGSIVTSYSSSDGMWGSANTVNPTGGITDILLLEFGFRVFGNVYYGNTGTGKPMETYTEVTLVGFGTISTGIDGYFEFNGVPDGSYTLTGNSTIAYGGLQALDAIFVQRAVAGLLAFTNLQFRSGDVNTNSSLQNIDATFIRRRAGGVWPISQWLAPDFVFDGPYGTPPALQGIPVTVSGADVNIGEFRTICSGDVNGSYTP